MFAPGLGSRLDHGNGLCELRLFELRLSHQQGIVAMSKQLDIVTNDQFGVFDEFGRMVFPQVVELNQQTFRKVPVSDSDGVKLLNAVQNRYHFISSISSAGSNPASMDSRSTVSQPLGSMASIIAIAMASSDSDIGVRFSCQSR